MVSGDARGTLRVWALDHEEHLVKYECTGLLTGPIKDLGWDGESKRIALCGERAPEGSADCAKAIAWDTGVSLGQCAQHLKGRAAALAMKPSRPFRLVTAGRDDTKMYFHKGPPFAKIPKDGDVPAESAHTKGAVFCVRYNSSGSLVASVGTDRAVCLYEGKTMALLCRLEAVHTATIYACAWSTNDKHILTASGDGTCKVFEVQEEKILKEVHTYKVAEHQLGQAYTRVPVGGNQVGCAYCHDDLPVSVGLNGQISILPKLGEDSSSNGTMTVLTGHAAPIGAMCMDTTNKVFYTGDSDGLLCQWDLTTCTPIRRLEAAEGNADLMYVVHGGAVSGLSLESESGTLQSIGWDDKLFTTSSSSTVQAVNMNSASLEAQPNTIASGKKVTVIGTVKGLVLSSNGKVTSGGVIPTSYDVGAVDISTDDQTVYVGGRDCKLHIYKVEGGGSSLSEIKVVDNATLKPITCMALSPDGTKLATGDARDVCVFDIQADYKPLIGKGRWCFHVQPLSCLSWADNALIASGGADDSIYLWSLAKNSKRKHYAYAHRGGLTGLAFVPGSDASVQFISTGVDSVVQKWDVTQDVKATFA
jgi:WD40 repeat protein